MVASAGQMLSQLDAQGLVTHRYLWGPAVDQLMADERVFPLPLGDGLGEGLAEALGAIAVTARCDALTLTPVAVVVWPLTDHLGLV